MRPYIFPKVAPPPYGEDDEILRPAGAGLRKTEGLAQENARTAKKEHLTTKAAGPEESRRARSRLRGTASGGKENDAQLREDNYIELTPTCLRGASFSISRMSFLLPFPGGSRRCLCRRRSCAFSIPLTSLPLS